MNKIKKTILALVVMTGFNTTFAAEHKNMMHSGVVAHSAWVRSAPVNAPALGAFMEIHNNTHSKVKLISAYVAGYKRVELHRTTNQNGVMKMQKQDFMLIPAQGRLQLKPGSWHIMLIGPKTVPSEGELVTISLKFDNGKTQTIHATVKKGKKMMMNHHKH